MLPSPVPRAGGGGGEGGEAGGGGGGGGGGRSIDTQTHKTSCPYVAPKAGLDIMQRCVVVVGGGGGLLFLGSFRTTI